MSTAMPSSSDDMVPAPLPAPPPPACENCMFAFAGEDIRDGHERFVCRRHPPSPRSTASDIGVADTLRWWWCGEYRQRTGGPVAKGEVP